jgi:outer membrane protein assembly factor BamE (lipoprotein component of BamABCDE complex)
MLRRVRLPRALVVLLPLVALLGCATHYPIEQRTTEGVSAETLFVDKSFRQNGREPTFEERQTWETRMDQQISAYLREHPEAANSLEVSKFRSLHQATVGMTKEQIRILLGAPVEMITDRAQLEKVARKYWPEIRDRAQEAWVYPLGWNLYFDGDQVVDVTQYVP